MYAVVTTPPILYVKVQAALGSRALEQLCLELSDKHKELQGNYDSIYIDLSSAYELDMNFRPATRSYFSMVREQEKNLVLINPTTRTQESLRKQGLGAFLKIKFVANTVAAPKSEFSAASAGQVDETELRTVLETSTDKILKVMGFGALPIQHIASTEPPVHALVAMQSSTCEVLVGLKFEDRKVLADAILKNFPKAEVNQAKLDQWNCELLNMFVAQIATSSHNTKWALSKVGQPSPRADFKTAKDLNFLVALTPTAAKAVNLQLNYVITPMESTIELRNETLEAKKKAGA